MTLMHLVNRSAISVRTSSIVVIAIILVTVIGLVSEGGCAVKYRVVGAAWKLPGSDGPQLIVFLTILLYSLSIGYESEVRSMCGNLRLWDNCINMFQTQTCQGLLLGRNLTLSCMWVRVCHSVTHGLLGRADVNWLSSLNKNEIDFSNGGV